MTWSVEAVIFYMAVAGLILYAIYYLSNKVKKVEKQWEGTREDLMKLTKKELDTFAYKWYDLKLDARTKKADMVEAIWSEMTK